MTLLQFHCFGKDYVLGTCDTKHVIQWINTETMEKGENILEEEILDKIEPLTNNVLIALGGITNITDHFKRKIKKLVNQDFFLDGCKEAAEEVYRQLFEERKTDKYIDAFLDSQFVGIYLLGFFQDGSTGCINLKEGNIETRKIDEDNVEFLHMFAPTQELLDKSEQLMDYSHSPVVNGNRLETVRNHFAIVQAFVSKVHPVEVSPRLLSYALFKDPETGKVICLQTDNDLSGFIENK